MSAEMMTALTAIGVAGLSTAGSVWVGLAARRTPRQEKRDDLAFATDRLEKDVARLELRVNNGELEIESHRERIADQDEAINWLRGRLRDLVGAFRIRGEEPPAARPIPERARRILNGIDV